jgi:hypothetical protein
MIVGAQVKLSNRRQKYNHQTGQKLPTAIRDANHAAV